MVSVFHPCADAKRSYILYRSPAKMAASSPPAAARISTMMSLSSAGSAGMSMNLMSSSSAGSLRLDAGDLLLRELLHVGVGQHLLGRGQVVGGLHVLARLLRERPLARVLLGQAVVFLLIGEHGRVAHPALQVLVGLDDLLELLSHIGFLHDVCCPSLTWPLSAASRALEAPACAWRGRALAVNRFMIADRHRACSIPQKDAVESHRTVGAPVPRPGSNP